jgi:hypothetical protein
MLKDKALVDVDGLTEVLSILEDVNNPAIDRLWAQMREGNGGQAMTEIQPIYGCKIDFCKPPRVSFWRRVGFALFGGIVKRWRQMGECK